MHRAFVSLVLLLLPSAAIAQKCRLPWPEGQTATVTQSWCSKCSGNGHCSSGLEFAIDFALPAGTPVLAAYEGTVAAVVESDNEPTCDLDGSWGNYVIIDHGDGTWTRYAHMQFQSVPVSVGQYVCGGRQIGTVGCTGSATGPHIHFQLQHSLSGPSVSFLGFVETGSGNIPNCNSATPASQNRRSTSSAQCFIAAYQGQTQDPPYGTWVQPGYDVSCCVTYKNIGGATWVNGPGGVSNPQYIELRSVLGDCTQVNGGMYHGTWINPQRIGAAQQAAVPRNSNATFCFTGNAPTTSGDHVGFQWVAPWAASSCVEGWAGVNFSVKVDGTQPSVSQTGGAAPGNYRTDQTVNFALSDTWSGVRGFCVSWDNPTPPAGPCVLSSSGSTTLGAAGSLYMAHTLYVHAWDNATPPNVSTVNLGTWLLGPNRAPQANCPAPQSVSEGSPLSFVVGGSDPDGDPVAIAALSLPPGATFDAGVFGWTPTFEQSGSYSATFRAGDGELTSDCAVPITVLEVNRAPIMSCPPNTAQVMAGDSLIVHFTAVDPDSAPTSMVAVAIPDGAIFSSGYLRWRPDNDQVGTHEAVIEASDGQLTDTCHVTIEVTMPVAVGITPTALRLLPARPNPFVGQTVLGFELPTMRHVSFEVFDVRGRHVRTLLKGTYGPGAYTTPWNSRDDAGRTLTSGVYFVRLLAGGKQLRSRIVILAQ